MTIIIAGDLVPTEVNIPYFKNGDLDVLLGNELKNLWNMTSLKIFNLETPISDVVDEIDKKGPNLIAPTSTIKGILDLDPTLITLANNHIMDQDIQGFHSTIDLLNENDIPHVGAGENLKEASKPYILKKNNITIGVYTCAEQEFTIATDKKPGANPFDPLESLDHIQELKNKCDYVIVLYHGGKEHYRYPSPYLQRVCRKIVEKGADLVVCQHSHCIGSYEKYDNSTIVYGQGNFIFNKGNNEYWDTSLLIKVLLDDDFEIEYIPIVRNDKGVSLATDKESERILEEYEERSQEIKNEGFVEKSYNNYASLQVEKYLRAISGVGKWYSRVDRILFKGLLTRMKFKRNELLTLENYINCEAHRELLLKGIEGKHKGE